MFKTKYYTMIFQKGKDILRVTIANRSLHVYDENAKTYLPRSHVITNCTDEHECVSMISYYYGMGYVLTKFKVQRMTILTWEEQSMLIHGIDIWKKWHH